MCGIAGVISTKKDIPLERMLSCIAHRGPDDSGMQAFQFENYVTTLLHRRLSIIDLSSAGHQPMSAAHGRFTITYNGELYNFLKIKKELESLGHRFLSKTDTEVILKSHEQWGADAITRFNGMFAYALWDDRDKKLLLVRDHAGQKPLYYANLPDGGIVFASEIKAILASELIRPEVNALAIPDYLGSLRVHAPDTMFAGVQKLPAAHVLEWNNCRVAIRSWWDPLEQFRPFHGSRSDAADEFLRLFTAAVKRHLIADVSVGAFLSGGLDSSLIVSLAAQEGEKPLTTFTTGFAQSDQKCENGKNELDFSRLLKDTLGSKIDYREIILAPDIVSLLPAILWHLDEPIADPAEINAYLICKAAREHGITVLLSGMGADEIFAGYNHHLMAWNTRHVDAFGSLGRYGSAAVAALLSALPLGSASRYLGRKGPFLSLPLDERVIGLMSWQTQEEVAGLLADRSMATDYLHEKKRHFNAHTEADLLNRILYTDSKTFLSEHNLMYTDKMSMASSCEVRSPFLDRDVMEFAFSLPPHFKISGWSGKDVVKRAAATVLPKEIAYQKKSGFAAPIRAWKQGLQILAAEYLSPGSPAVDYFNNDGVLRLIANHAAGRDVSYQLWSLITFGVWHHIYIESKP